MGSIGCENCSVDGATASLFFLSQNECLASLDGDKSSSLAGSALELECNLLGGLGLLSENGLGLSSETSLLGIISSLSLSDGGSLASLVLLHLVGGMLQALTAVSPHLLGNVDLHKDKIKRGRALPFI